MDLGTMKKKLDAREYSRADDFLDDFNLMIRNCMTFNPAGTLVQDAGVELQRVFNDKWANLPPLKAPQPDSEDEEEDDEDDTDAAQATNYALKVNPDGTVEQEDTVRYVIRSCIFHIIFIDLRCRLWESGYRERYYKQKFGVAYSDVETRKKYTFTPSTFRSISCEF